MKGLKLSSIFLVSAIGVFSSAAQAVNTVTTSQGRITLTASVNTALALYGAGGKAWDPNMDLAYDMDSGGFQTQTRQISIKTNDGTKQLQARLASPLQMKNGTQTVDMAVKLGSLNMTQVFQKIDLKGLYTFKDAKTGYDVTGYSNPIDLIVSQAPGASALTNGNYTGDLVLEVGASTEAASGYTGP